ncbi:peptidoglycan DD-metalloendopeptidase family protein [Tepidibacter hydrothermalis]|uniref:Peptidoglycan DD-metalloendopeptidase family protein n=1 Tax=Tepidibacter hydrothermalis TaxID=3036126 RepID=A0ABY8EAW4_9FIRM|nr:peptidoglycan DD-metalloendopeptidase family protein [Tepidibacter hydrothermalis]WFD10061.1 peptidoglycan DD-metalloendopeptidase family protein [Tepidibacter hydrothermalis]
MDNKKNKFKKLLEKDGFYLVLFVCVCLVALTAVWVTKNSIDNIASENGFVNYEQGELIDDDKVASNEDDEIHLIKEDGKAVPTSTDSKQNLADAKQKLKQEKQAKEEPNKEVAQTTKIKAIMPVEGKLGRDYSDNKPTYSATLEQWELHKGIDIQAKQGTPVSAFMDGEVLEVLKDSVQGITVKLKHQDNIVSVYSNLSLDTKVQKGKKVKCKDVIGNIGNTSIIESKEAPHLHFEVLKDNKNIDPLSIINSN